MPCSEAQKRAICCYRLRVKDSEHFKQKMHDYSCAHYSRVLSDPHKIARLRQRAIEQQYYNASPLVDVRRLFELSRSRFLNGFLKLLYRQHAETVLFGELEQTESKTFTRFPPF